MVMSVGPGYGFKEEKSIFQGRKKQIKMTRRAYTCMLFRVIRRQGPASFRIQEKMTNVFKIFQISILDQVP